jgi:uncharacterized protein (TIGR00730 family)
MPDPATSSFAGRAAPTLSLCIYCGSRPGADPAYAAAAAAVGHEIGRRGWGLVYGGGRAGLMGTVADAALAAGARVVGVIPRSLMDRELGHPGLAELHVVETMHQRKQLMAERSDAFLALPGGIGTFEELFEVWTWRQLGYHDKPVGLLEVAGYYAPLVAFVDGARDQGFVPPAQRALLQVDEDVTRLLDRLAVLALHADAPDDYRRI